ncbi:hypothetical protein ACQJBY_073037 [Aegilops geniculata]
MATALAGCAWPSVPSKLYPPFTLCCLWCAPAMSGKPAGPAPTTSLFFCFPQHVSVCCSLLYLFVPLLYFLLLGVILSHVRVAREVLAISARLINAKVSY